MTLRSIAEAKAQAKALRQALADQGTPIRQAEALERIARQNGARDWNTLHAQLSRSVIRDLRPQAPVQGYYLGLAFTGRIVALTKLGKTYRIKIKFDQPLDTVKFESFSNWRSQIQAVIGEDGCSPDLTSDGVPQLIVKGRSRQND
ncbi:hypothetical protein TG4357_02393 [Thalassovita gelatinovora]|uniref:Glyoxalase-related protein domain-containing protein n=1 Tax=Thalassovita gelatinovora TaxID=53501 RepID=A0A0N7LVI1_THAGE|nr:glyoxalase superfamily protein [Thalassovita gelatinovora]QIZ81504.1 hypothetical protein HFZ77_13955 [Thalassovita gelatinovora]CUH66362.1 hypothetical protein TG4357_02393 [Thalassovita gelatinovora]SEQ24588.1 hypothetical protein SAMN04488043_104124 [Thalassovita gelatinovora]